MTFCPVCGGRLRAGESLCPSCGAEYDAMMRELEGWREESSKKPDRAATATPVQQGRCLECGKEAEEECFFCSASICPKHAYPMRIHSMNVGMGDEVKACFVCAKKMEGTTPSRRDAERVGIYFNVKPYYEWKRV
ncbi:MAG: hypothetical protein DRN40_00915 [Thermoplasmata archaeon]|nr:MAG: hypothetical protein DRN40_00915 [Thermoplasmata archaeon]